MKSDFLEYIQKEFGFSPDEMRDFQDSLSMPLKKSIRINTKKISVENFKNLAQKNGWTLTPTSYGKNTFYIDRDDTSVALGNTYEHLAGYFYVQEVAASLSPFYLANDTIDEGEYLILDMSAAPGGKSTQLSEYFPNSIIIANEIDKGRLLALEENINRMSGTNILVTNYDGRHFKNVAEIFDKILLDAPCSGEGTAFKTDDALKYWNLKNIEKIALLQLQLLESSLISLKVGGELVYSTCTLNRYENEFVIEKIIEKYGASLEIIPLQNNLSPSSSPQGEGKGLGVEGGDISLFVRNWPHRQKTGGFFVAKLRKIKSLDSYQGIEKKERFPKKNNSQKSEKFVKQNFEKLQNKHEKLIKNSLEKEYGLQGKYNVFKYKDAIYLTHPGTNALWEKFFFYHMGIEIGIFKGGNFEPGFFLGTLQNFETQVLEISNNETKKLLSGYEIDTDEKNGFYTIKIGGICVGMGKVTNRKLKSLIPSKMVRK